MAKKLNDHLVKIIQNSPKMTISEHSKSQKLEDKDLQKMIIVYSWKVHAHHQLYKKTACLWALYFCRKSCSHVHRRIRVHAHHRVMPCQLTQIFKNMYIVLHILYLSIGSQLMPKTGARKQQKMIYKILRNCTNNF